MHPLRCRRPFNVWLLPARLPANLRTARHVKLSIGLPAASRAAPCRERQCRLPLSSTEVQQLQSRTSHTTLASMLRSPSAGSSKAGCVAGLMHQKLELQALPAPAWSPVGFVRQVAPVCQPTCSPPSPATPAPLTVYQLGASLPTPSRELPRSQGSIRLGLVPGHVEAGASDARQQPPVQLRGQAWTAEASKLEGTSAACRFCKCSFLLHSTAGRLRTAGHCSQPASTTLKRCACLTALRCGCPA